MLQKHASVWQRVASRVALVSGLIVDHGARSTVTQPGASGPRAATHFVVVEQLGEPGCPCCRESPAEGGGSNSISCLENKVTRLCFYPHQTEEALSKDGGGGLWSAVAGEVSRTV